MPDDARDAAEEESAFSHPPVDPDTTAAYGDHPDQVVDFYAPRGGEERAPLVVVLHGGAWRAPYDRRHITPFADFLARRGFAVANVEYRRGGTIPAQGGDGPVAGRWPDTFDDVAAALDAMPGLVRGALPQADARRMVVTGHSAGGQLALWAAARHLLPADAPWRTDRPAPLRGVVALAPIADFTVAEKLDVCSGASSNSWAERRSSANASRTPTRPCSSRRASPRPWSRAARTSSYRRPSPRHTRTRRPRPARW